MIDGIISSQVVDQFEIEPGWREAMVIPLALKPEENEAILADTKLFMEKVLGAIETKNKFYPLPRVALMMESNKLVLSIKGCCWRFKVNKFS